MRKKKTYKLEYRIDGIINNIDIAVDFVSNRVRHEYGEILQQANVIKDIWDRLSDINSLIAAEEVEQNNGYKERVENYLIEIKEKSQSIIEFSATDFLLKRYEVTKRILIDNGYKENLLLMSKEFWNDNVDPTDQIEFLNHIVFKDDSKKKMQH